MYTGKHCKQSSFLNNKSTTSANKFPSYSCLNTTTRFPSTINQPQFQSKIPTDIVGPSTQPLPIYSKKQPFLSHSISSPDHDPNRFSEFSDIDAEQSDGPSVPSTKRGRGRTQMLKTWGGEPSKVELNELNQAVGKNAGTMASQMGRKVKHGNLFPLDCKDWRIMDNYIKDLTWMEFQANFALEDRYKKEFLKKLGNIWKNWKHEVKSTYYEAYRTDEERLANCPDMVEKEQWPKLVEFWSSKEGKQISGVNTYNRSKLRVIARTGRKSFATVRDEVTKEKGDISDFEFWMLTKVGMAKTPLDKKTTKFVENLSTYISNHPDALKSKEMRDQLLAKCLGPEKSGQMRSYGFGPTPSQIATLTYQKQFFEEKVSVMASALRDKLKEEIKNELKDLIEEAVREAVSLLMNTTPQGMPTRKNVHAPQTRAQPSNQVNITRVTQNTDQPSSHVMPGSNTCTHENPQVTQKCIHGPSSNTTETQPQPPSNKRKKNVPTRIILAGVGKGTK